MSESTNARIHGSAPDVAETGKAYDTLASRFERIQQENPVLAQSARVSEKLVASAMSDRSRLLEIGCGTGRETLKLAAMGKRVVACDVSKVSLELLAEQAAKRELLDFIETRNVSASGLAALEGEFGPHAFDGAFSSFALHYEPDLGVVPGPLGRLLKPDSPFLCTIFNRLCLMEVLLLAPFLVPRRGLRRLEGEMKLPVDRFYATIRSWTPSQVNRIFGTQFALVQTWGVPAIIPPSYLHALVTRSGILQPVWENLDQRVNGVWPFRNLGSHTAFLFRSRPQPQA